MKLTKIYSLLFLSLLTSCFEPDVEDLTEESKKEIIDDFLSFKDSLADLGIGIEITPVQNSNCINYFTYIDSTGDGKYITEETYINEPKDLCLGDNPDDLEVLYDVTFIEESNSSCNSSQFRLDLGLDENEDGILQQSEVMISEINCNDITQTADTSEI